MAIFAGAIGGRVLAGAAKLGIVKTRPVGFDPKRGGLYGERAVGELSEGLTTGAKLTAAYGAHEGYKGGKRIAGRARRKHL